jgi:hypothetical protein
MQKRSVLADFARYFPNLLNIRSRRSMNARHNATFTALLARRYSAQPRLSSRRCWGLFRFSWSRACFTLAAVLDSPSGISSGIFVGPQVTGKTKAVFTSLKYRGFSGQLWRAGWLGLRCLCSA